MSFEPLAERDLPELDAFLKGINAGLGDANLRQFCRPGDRSGGIAITTLVLREQGRIQGTIGWIDLPAVAAGAPVQLRWPINQYLAPECRGRGLGKALMEATRPGATLRCVIGGNAASMPILDRTGYVQLGSMSRFIWRRPALAAGMLRNRLMDGPRAAPPARLELSMQGRRLTARRVGAPPEPGWIDRPPAREIQIPRTSAYLRFAFGGPLEPLHVIYAVESEGVLLGCFVLAARTERRPVLSCEIIDIDCRDGAERECLEAALRTARAGADVVRLRICGTRFLRAAREAGGREATDHPVRVSCDPSVLMKVGDINAWHLTYGDHDQYRARAASRVWKG